MTVCDLGRQLPHAGSESLAKALQLAAVAPANRPLDLAIETVLIGQVLGDQPPGETGRTPDHDIEGLFHVLP